MVCFYLESKLLCFRAAVRAACMFSLPPQRRKQPRWGREHLVDLERSEQIYLVIRDHQTPQCSRTITRICICQNLHYIPKTQTSNAERMIIFDNLCLQTILTTSLKLTYSLYETCPQRIYQKYCTLNVTSKNKLAYMLKQIHIQIAFGAILFGGICFFAGYMIHKIYAPSFDSGYTKYLDDKKYSFINPILDFHPPLTPLQKNEVQTLTNRLKAVTDSYTKNDSVTEVSVYYRDLKNGPWILINGESLYTPASLLKVPTMISLLKLAEKQPEILEEEITYNQDFSWAPTHQFADTKNPLIQGETYTVSYLIEKMIIDSDNIATLLLEDRFGTKLSDQLLLEFNLPLPYINDWYKPFITIRDYASFFRILYNSTYLNHTYSNTALEILSKTTFKEGIKAVAPDSSVVSNKFGIYTVEEGQLQVHDCGIVYNQNEHYVICVMTKGKDGQKLIELIRQVAKTIFDFKEKR